MNDVLYELFLRIGYFRRLENNFTAAQLTMKKFHLSV